ncbi:sensor histidine kinase [Wenzhouxiangella sp. AB-CW3]|uniref:sensor histidine kinase n=1 Tax=Wenzhouxiangella sp. AB-CW3 TaxID=2771012 RepID=UPI00168B551A|nr:sensor histidine kinase [Wenzhouxiangella sp. AB-CW3]QOC21776.1 sensor histidine kinase [Wenzhouxiangella sp. AB-CW3]
MWINWVNGFFGRLQQLGELKPIEWLRYVGTLLWVLTALPLLILPLLMPEGAQTVRIAGWWAGALLFLVALWHPVIPRQRQGAFWKRVFVLVLLSLGACAVSYFTRSGLGSLLAMLVAALLPWLLPLVIGVAWAAVLAVVISVWVLVVPDGNWQVVLVYLLMNLAMTSVPFVASLLALRQVKARAELRRVNSELLATQSLLTENTRIAERVRISRDLHDLVGHHLTALTLNLEVASHLSEGKARDHVDKAGSIARLLLSDVREVVSDMRRDDQVDLREALTTLAEGVPDLEITLDIPDGVAATDPRRAQILLRCAQEVITNTVRHAQATRLWISLIMGEDGLVLRARDNGRGAPDILPGNGINGMRERLREIGGRLDIATRPGAGFQVKAWLPQENAS